MSASPSRVAAMDAVRANMSAAILKGCDAVVDVTPNPGNGWCTSGQDAHVIRARVVMSAAGLVFLRSETDEELPGERFDYWRT